MDQKLNVEKTWHKIKVNVHKSGHKCMQIQTDRQTNNTLKIFLHQKVQLILKDVKLLITGSRIIKQICNRNVLQLECNKS